MDWAMDYLSEIQLTLNTYIARAPAAFVLEPQRPRALLGIVQRVLDFSNAQDQDVQVCVCVRACVCLYGRQHRDEQEACHLAYSMVR